MTAAVGHGEVERFRSVVARRLGLQLEDAKLGPLADVLRRRLDANGRSAGTYLESLGTEPSREELGVIARELTVSETYFFRHLDQFRAFAEVALPERMRARATQKRLHVLSAGCASGEEPYSLAIFARETMPDPSWDVSVLGVDVNPAALEKATLGRYSTWALRETPAEAQRRWFRPGARDFVLDETLRRSVKFEERNLVEGDADLWQTQDYDVVFCRNVLMYLTVEGAQTVVGRLTRALVPGGYLFLGHAETLRGLSNDFQLRHTHGTFYYQRREHLDDRSLESAYAASSSLLSTSASPVVPDGADTWVETIRKASERIEALTTSRPPATEGARKVRSERPDLGAALELLERERYGEALDRVSALPPSAAGDPDVLLLRAVLLTHGGRLADAEDACERLLTRDELNAGAHYTLALCREGRGDRQGALDHDRVAIYLDRHFAMPRLHLGMVARKGGELEIAQRELGQALVLLQREDAARLLLFGGGFKREALVALCRAELASCGGQP